MKLSKEFFEQPTLNVARKLLGCTLVFQGPTGTYRGEIVETEAYIGPEDLASHASKGQTKRTAPMFGPAGLTYIYLIYGIYWCLNIVTEDTGYPAAVLIRALAPIKPLDDLRAASGPGKLTRWLGVDGSYNLLDVTGDILYIETTPETERKIVATTRIGVDYAKEWREKPWRFYLQDHPSVSKK